MAIKLKIIVFIFSLQIWLVGVILKLEIGELWFMALVGLYCLVVDDPKGKRYVASFKGGKTKVPLPLIDQFTCRYSNESEWLKSFRDQNVECSEGATCYIEYERREQLKQLEPIYGNALLGKVATEIIKADKTTRISSMSLSYQKIVNMFLRMLKNKTFFQELQGSIYANQYLKQACKDFLYCGASDDLQRDAYEAEASIRQQLCAYKELRGVVLLLSHYQKRKAEEVKEENGGSFKDLRIEAYQKLLAGLLRQYAGDLDLSLVPDLDTVYPNDDDFCLEKQI